MRQQQDEACERRENEKREGRRGIDVCSALEKY